jgi:ribosomal silencing factor RsfS
MVSARDHLIFLSAIFVDQFSAQQSMTAFTSRRALLTFARLISPNPVIYRCTNCIRLGRGASVAGGRGNSLGIRQFSRGAVRYQSNEDPDPDEFEGSFLDYQLSTRKEDGRRIISEPPVEELAPKERRGRRIKSTSRDDELQQIAAGLEWSEMNIEELEDSLMNADPIESSPIEVEAEDEELQPWYLRQDGGISEEEYSSIETLFNSEDSNEPTKIHQSEIMPHESAEEAPRASQEDSDMLPWYLREQESDTSLTPRIDIEQTQLENYPDIPSDGPPLLQPLVSRLFYDHHLRNIVLLDLRRRDPPPAWGSNTIMIIATVRSERQLSSVAEATSKWLKTTAGVLPKTDGLPKRESLIIKRRRLRKKSLRKPGYLIAAPRPTTWVSMYTGYQGLVLQLFTEEGREEYDLEGLWGDSRVVDAAELDMKPRKVRPGGIEEDEPVEFNRSVSQKKPVWQKKEEKEEKKREKKMQLKSAKRRWTQEEKDQARKQRMKEAAGISFWESPRRDSSSGRRATYGDRQQRRQLHTSGTYSLDQSDFSPTVRSIQQKRSAFVPWE